MTYRVRLWITATVILATFAGSALAARQPVACDYGKGKNFPADGKKYKVYLIHETSEAHRLFDFNCDGIISGDEVTAMNAWAQENVALKQHNFERKQQAGIRTPKPIEDTPPIPKVGGWSGPRLVLRETFSDIKVFSDSNSETRGANFSYANNREAHNGIWTAKGVVALPVTWTGTNLPTTAFNPSLAGFALAPFAKFDRVANTNNKIAKKDDVDVLTYGGSGEIAIGNVFDAASTHHFSGRIANVTSFDGDRRSWNAVAEYQPYTGFDQGLNLSAPSPFIIPYWNIVIDPKLRLHYAEKEGHEKDPLFDERDKVLRAGSSVKVAIYSDQGPNTPIPPWLQRALFTLEYSWLQDVRTHKTYEHWNAGVAFALDDKGDVAITFSYEKGRIEDTAQLIDLAKVGLSVKR